jgi:hypothetical protein
VDTVRETVEHSALEERFVRQVSRGPELLELIHLEAFRFDESNTSFLVRATAEVKVHDTTLDLTLPDQLGTLHFHQLVSCTALDMTEQTRGRALCMCGD